MIVIRINMNYRIYCQAQRISRECRWQPKMLGNQLGRWSPKFGKFQQVCLLIGHHASYFSDSSNVILKWLIFPDTNITVWYKQFKFTRKNILCASPVSSIGWLVPVTSRFSWKCFNVTWTHTHHKRLHRHDTNRWSRQKHRRTTLFDLLGSFMAYNIKTKVGQSISSSARQ